MLPNQEVGVTYFYADYPFPGYHEQQNALPAAKEKYPSAAGRK
jgi:hypothetical protein